MFRMSIGPVSIFHSFLTMLKGLLISVGVNSETHANMEHPINIDQTYGMLIDASSNQPVCGHLRSNYCEFGGNTTEIMFMAN